MKLIGKVAATLGSGLAGLGALAPLGLCCVPVVASALGVVGISTGLLMRNGVAFVGIGISLIGIAGFTYLKKNQQCCDPDNDTEI